MPLYRDQAVVLRTQKLGEADRIVTLLTRRHGRVRAVAKGVRRTGSKFGARVEPFMHVDLQLHTANVEGGSGLDIVTQAETLAPYGEAIAADYGRYTAGTAVLETAERLTAEEREPSLRLFLLMVGALRALADGEHVPTLVLDAFILRALAISGYEPVLDGCALCGTPGPHRSFVVGSGGVVCGDHRPPGAPLVAVDTLELMTALLGGDWTVADAANPKVQRETSGVVAAYLQWHLERGLRSLRLVERT
ncbi:MAG TPA: DNA repair protein RecO [Mycobacteriales bacterium]|nr:DNA repair protein RecO [Mycobacteriales bacterium]